MNDASTVNAPRQPDRVLHGALRRARWVVFWERLWPALASLAVAAGAFLAASWFGLWLHLPPVGRAVGLCAFAVLALTAALPLLRLRFPSRLDGLRRLDRNSDLPHRPATAISDDLATPRSDPWSAALWRAHIERALAAALHLRAGAPAPRLDRVDPVAVRALVLLLAVTGFMVAGGDRTRRVAAAFDWHGVVTAANFRLDAWVSPPGYTGKPPVILPGLRPGEHAQTAATALAVPSGSVLVVRASGDVQFNIDTRGGVAEVPADQRPDAPGGTQERRFAITSSGTAEVKRLGEDDLTYGFNAIPDKPPVIVLNKDPESQPGGSLKLSYRLEDDYGVVDARAHLALAAPAKAAPDRIAPDRTGTEESRHPLFEAPEFQLSLPQARVRNATGETTKDLTEHPFAGAEVVMTLTARDEADNTATTAPYTFRLPERPFAKELARAVIEQRRLLALDADNRDRVLIALDALAMAPEKFMPELGHYLGLRSLFFQLSEARDDDGLRDVVKSMWTYAVMLEDGNMADAADRLKNAEQALRNALERGAPPEEIKRLMEELRAAMDQFMQSLAEEMRKNPDMARPDPKARQLGAQDLKSMLDRLENMARNGDRDAARQMLDDLAQMMQNLQMARPQDGDSGDDMQSMMDDLGDIIRKQQQLRDNTHRQGQDQQRQDQQQRQGQRGQRPRGGQQGQQGQQGGDQQDQNGDPNAFNELRDKQQALRDQLKKLQEEMKKRGLGQKGPDKGQQDGKNGNGQQGGKDGQGQQGGEPGGGDGNALGDAEGAMGDAEDALADGNPDSATDSQGRAIEALRRGAQSLAQEMQQQGQQQGQGGAFGPPGMGRSRADRNSDPLGRPRGREYDGTSVRVPGEIDVQRARRIIEELRRRFGESSRPQLELDYIERLLKDY